MATQVGTTEFGAEIGFRASRWTVTKVGKTEFGTESGSRRETCAVLLQKPMESVLNRNTNTSCSTRLDTGTTASPHCILFARPLTMPACSSCPNKDRTQTCDRNCPTSFRNTHHKHCTEPWRNDISNFFPLARSFHTVLTLSAASEPQSHAAFRAVASCSVPRSCRRDVAFCTSDERSVCNSEISQSSLVLTLCHINLRTTRAQFPRHRYE